MEDAQVMTQKCTYTQSGRLQTGNTGVTLQYKDLKVKHEINYKLRTTRHRGDKKLEMNTWKLKQ